MITTYFGLPGCGKTTKFVQLAVKESRLIDRGKSRYKYIVGNIDLVNVPHYNKINFQTLGKIGYPDALVLIDEASLECDSRDFKNFARHTLEYFLLHRHWNNDVHLFSQQWNGIDLKIRAITNKVVYLHKSPILRFLTRETTIRYGVVIPKIGENKGGEICMGYFDPGPVAKFFEPRFIRCPYYKYFDSWTRPNIPLFRPSVKAPEDSSERKPK